MVQQNKTKKESVWSLIIPAVLGVVVGVGIYYSAAFFRHVSTTKLAETMPSFVLPKGQTIRLPDPEKGPHLGAFLAGITARSNGDMERAADYYARALSLDPDNELLLARTYAIERGVGNFNQMLALADKMQGSGLAQSEPAYVQFVGLIQKGDYAAARDLLQTKPGVFAPDAALRIWCAIGLGETPKALREWNALNTHSTQTDSFRLQKALIADYLGETAEAEKAFLSLKDVEMVDISTLAYARAFFKKQGKWTPEHPLYAVYMEKLEEAGVLGGILDAMEAPVIDTPVKGIAEVFHGLVFDAAYAGNLDTAMLATLITVYLNPESPFTRVRAAQVYEALNMNEMANKQYDALPKTDVFILRKAMNFVSMGQGDKALETLEPVKERFAQDGLVQLLLASTYLQEKRYPEAIHHYNIFMSLTPPKTDEWVSALFARGVAYHESGDMAAAERDIAAAAEHAPENPVILNYIGYLWLIQDKHIDKSVEMVEKAVAAMPDNPNFLDSLAWGYYKQGRFSEALGFAEKATDMLPQSAVVNEHLGDIYAAVGRHREAQYQYKKTLSLKDKLKEEDKARIQSKIK